MGIGQIPAPDGVGQDHSGNRTWLIHLRSHRKTLVAAVLVALTVGLAAHLLHVGAHAGHEAGLSTGVYHWLRDSVLAIPLAALIIYAVNDFTRPWTSARAVLARLRWGLLVGLAYAFALIPGGMAHGRLFPAEAHTGDAFRHALVDAVALLPASVYTGVAVALLFGMPSETTAPVVSTFRRVRAYEWGTVSWRPAQGAVARIPVALAAFLTILPAPAIAGPAAATQSSVIPPTPLLANAHPARCVEPSNGQPGNRVYADVVALDQPFYYNRLGALNANGMIYALARDVVVDNPLAIEGLPADGTPVSTILPADRAGLQGNVSLRQDKRPRPLTLRANEGDCLDIAFTNLLTPVNAAGQAFVFNLPPDFLTQPFPGVDREIGTAVNPEIDDQPLTREASIHVDGMELLGDIGSDGSNVGANATAGNGLVGPGGSATYSYFADATGTHLLYSMGSTVGGEGTGGTRSYGLFGAVNVQPGPSSLAGYADFPGAVWYRSQLTRVEMDLATPAEDFVDWNGDGTRSEGIAEPFVDAGELNGSYDLGEAFTDWNENGIWDASVDEPFTDWNGDGVWNQHRSTPDGQPVIDYDAVYPAGTGGGKDGLPIIKILAPKPGYRGEIVHSDLNAIIDDRGYHGYAKNDAYPTRSNPANGYKGEPYREFTVIFHDEAFGVQAFPGFYNDPVLQHTLHGVSDSFPINYGSGGIGSEIIANRLGVGPMWDCSECKYEEFFLTSFTVGDPAMIVDIPANTDANNDGVPDPGSKATKALYPEDPSNVHHSYLGDRVVFRNLHAGPKEHHIFHLHAHQWQFNPDDPQSNYLDGQALGPGSGYTYEIAYGGSGNRNLTPGDSIFHCHFYPHFAQGMWELWRVHDVFEQGTVMDLDEDGLPIPAVGSRALPDGEIPRGTPIPGVVPMPGMAMPLMPDAAATTVPWDLNGPSDGDAPNSSQFDADGDGQPDIFQDDDSLGIVGDEGGAVGVELTNPGYPWFTPGLLGHRPPTPAKDLLDDGGLPRHVITSGPDEDNLAHDGAPVEMYVSRLDFNKVLHEASGIELPEDGTAVERVAMNFHAGKADGDGNQFYSSYTPEYRPLNESVANFEVNGLDPAPGAPYADPCRSFDGSGYWTEDYAPGTDTFRTIKGANIEMPITLNKVGWHFQQQRFEALWEDVVPTLNNERAPQPMVMRLNSTDCAEFHHANLVPNVYQLDDYQVRTPTDIIGQHIHLVKFDVMAADGSANGFNYEDGTLSPDEVRERIEAFNNGGGFDPLGPETDIELAPEAHPYFGATGPNGQNWLGARTTIQRWYADPLLERSWDGGVGTVFTHDHYGPSTHQQVGLYSTLLVEPADSVWLHNETGEQLGVRVNASGEPDGGASGWQAIIVDCEDAQNIPGVVLPDPQCSGAADFEAHREFYFEFADFQHAYEDEPGTRPIGPDGEPTGFAGDPPRMRSNENLIGPSIDIPTYDQFESAINPSFRLPPNGAGGIGTLADIYLHPNWCPGNGVPVPGGAGALNVQRPCAEAISADDPGTYALNFRNEPIGLRVFEDANLNGQLDPGEDTNGNGVLDQVAGAAGDLAFAYQSRTDRAIPELNSQPAGPYPPLTADIRPGDPWTPLLRVYMGDKVRIRVQVGAHEEEHNFTIPGLKWRQEPNSPNSGWRNSEFFGIDEYFNLDVPIVPDTESGTPAEVDYIYTVGAELEGMWNGVWGVLRSYGKERNDLVEVPDRDVGRNGYVITNDADYDGICPVTAPLTPFDVTAVRAVDVLGDQGIVYNSRGTAVIAPAGGVTGVGPLTDPTALMYVLTDDLVFDAAGNPVGLKPGTPVEPLILRANAGDCITVNLTNALLAHGDPDLSATEMPGFNALPPIVHKDEQVAVPGQGGILSFNANDLTPSSYVGLTPQLLAFDPRTDGGFSTGLTTGRLVAPGDTGTYKWYAGDVRVTSPTQRVRGNRTQFTLEHTPVEFGAVGLMPADRIKGSESGFVGAMVIEPLGSTWVEDPGTRTQATVYGPSGEPGQRGEPLFRDFVVIMQNDVNLRYGGDASAIGGADCTDAAALKTMQCAVPSIAAEGPQGPPEDPQDSGQKAINYGADPLWFRLGITPDTKFEQIHRDPGLAGLIPDVFANSRVGGDPQVPVFRASPTGPDQGRFRVLMPGGHARGTTWTVHGHQWERQPYRCGEVAICDMTNGSSVIGDRNDPGTGTNSEYYGSQEGINPTGHWDFVVDLGGSANVPGDYLLRDQASFGSYQGLWGLLRYDFTAPVAVDVSVTTPKYGQVTTPVLGADLDGDPTTVSIVSNPLYGTATVNPDGTITYQSTAWPECGPFACADSFVYGVSDGTSTTEATVFVDVTNTAPVANSDAAEMQGASVGDAVTVSVLANDFDAEGDLARSPVVDIPGTVDKGSASVGADGSVTFTYEGGPPGLVQIPYSVTDESGAESNEAIIRIGVNVDSIRITRARYQENQARWAIDGTCTDPSQTIAVHFGIDSDGTPVIASDIPCGADNLWNFQGQATDAADIVVNAEAPNFVSAESSGLGVDWGVLVEIIGANNPPTAVADEYVGGLFNGTLFVAPPGVLENDADADFDPLTAAQATAASFGTVSLDPDGSFTYQPNPTTYEGSDSFSYVANDGSDDSVPAQVTVSGPVGLPDSYAMAVGASELVVNAPGVLDNDFGGGQLTAGIVNEPDQGTIVLGSDGSFVYSRSGGVPTGVDTFTYEVCAGAVCSQATVSINVTNDNSAPSAADDFYSVSAGTTLDVGVPGVLGNDIDPDPNTSLEAVLDGPPSNGVLALNGDGSFTYTPDLNFSGIDTFTYRADDGTDTSNVATVTINVTDVVTVDSATYRIRRDRWQVQGSVSDVDSAVTLYMCTDDGCVSRSLIGLANVSAIDGSWNFNGTGAARPAGSGPAWVVAVSSTGSESAFVEVTIRN